MKIIARINCERVLVEMTEREVANVAGFNYERQLPYSYLPEDALRVGVEYNVAQAWQRLQEQATAADKLEGVAKTLAALSDLVTQTKVQFINCTETNGGEL